MDGMPGDCDGYDSVLKHVVERLRGELVRGLMEVRGV
jgi:hypothetical protein